MYAYKGKINAVPAPHKCHTELMKNTKRNVEIQRALPTAQVRSWKGCGRVNDKIDVLVIVGAIFLEAMNHVHAQSGALLGQIKVSLI